MSWTGAGERTVKEWLAGSNAPRAFQLESLFRSSEAVYQRIMLRTGRQPIVTRHKLETVRGQLSGLVEALDTALAEQEEFAVRRDSDTRSNKSSTRLLLPNATEP
jgi:hypothetical protein